MKRKQLFALLLALALVFSLCACGSKEPQAELGKNGTVTLGVPESGGFEGKWICIREEYVDTASGEVLMAASLKDMEEIGDFAPDMTFSSDGTGILAAEGEEIPITWESNGERALTMKGDAEVLGAESMEGTLSDGLLTLHFMEEDGMRLHMIYAREGDPAIEESKTVNLMEESLGMDFTEAETITLLLDEEVGAEFTDNIYTVPAEFTADKDGWYTFTTSGGMAPGLTRYSDAEQTDYLDSEWGYEGEEVTMTIQLAAGETAYFSVAVGEMGDVGTAYILTTYAESEPLPDDVIVLELDRAEAVTLDDFFETKFAFTPKASGEYTFASQGETDTNGTLYDGYDTWDANELAYDFDSGENGNFVFTAALEAGVTYYLCVGSWDGGDTQVSVTAAGGAAPAAAPAPEGGEPAAPASASGEAGKYNLVRYEANGSVIEGDLLSLNGMDETFVQFNEDGTGVLHLLDTESEIEYAGGQITMFGTPLYTYTIDGDDFTLDMQGVYYYMVREGGASSGTAAASDKIAGGETIEMWDGDFYGWWMCDNCTGSWAEAGMDGMWWDCCARLERDGALTEIEVWDEDGASDNVFCNAVLEISDDGLYAFSTQGMFYEMTFADDNWYADAESEDFENMLIIDGHYEGNDTGFDFLLYLRPWGQDWSDVEAETPEDLPYYYYDWYLPLIQAGEAMPDSIG